MSLAAVHREIIMTADYSQKVSPKIIWSGNFLGGKLVVTTIPSSADTSEGYKDLFFRMDSYECYYQGTVSVSESATSAAVVAAVLGQIEVEYCKFILSNRDRCSDCGEFHDDSKAILH